MRKEKDFLGKIEIASEALYGIHSLRAKNNFPSNERFSIDWYKAVGKVKQACYATVKMFRAAIVKEHPDLLETLNLPSVEVLDIMTQASREISKGNHFEFFIVPALQGGAGTSINLNINEIIANRALELSGKKPGDYSIIDPIEDANIYQSTNDVIPTALVVASMDLLKELEAAINDVRKETERLEKEHSSTLRLSYTQLEEAVPGTYGLLFSAYSDALSRDWWRVSKAFERIKQVNLGGGASGTSIGIPRFYIMEVVNQLRKISGLAIAQGENLSDITSNLDSYVEVHAILKAHAVNLEKIASDLRLLASGLTGKEVIIPEQQTGSSIMPGKVNPVIPEFIISSAHKIYSNDQLISSLAGQGNLELNAYLPSIGNALLDSIHLLISMNETIKDNLLIGLKINEKLAAEKLYMSPSVSTALSPLFGYNKAAQIAKYMKEHGVDIFKANEELKFIAPEKMKKLMQADNLLKKGFTLKDIREFNEE